MRDVRAGVRGQGRGARGLHEELGGKPIAVGRWPLSVFFQLMVVTACFPRSDSRRGRCQRQPDQHHIDDERRMHLRRGDADRSPRAQVHWKQHVGAAREPERRAGARKFYDQRPGFETGDAANPEFEIEAMGQVVPDRPAML